MLFRIALFLVVALLTTFSAQGAEEARCRFHSKSSDVVEWFDGAAPRSARFIDQAAGWKLLMWLEGNYSIDCETCRDGQGIGGALWIDIGDPDKRDLEGLLHPDSVASAIRTIPGGPFDFHALRTGTVASLSIFGLEGRAVATALANSSGVVDGFAIVASDECLVLFGFVHVGKQKATTIDDVRSFAASKAVQMHDAHIVRHSPPERIPARPLTECEFPLGDARKRCQEQQR